MTLPSALYYVDLGNGTPLLLVHGGLSNGRATWDRQIATLPSIHRLLVPDRRGHGRSPREPRPYTIDGDAADMLHIADLAGAEKVHLGGHSYGGLVALEAALRAPERVLSLHLIEPPYLSLLPDDPDVRALDQRVRKIRTEGEERGPEWVAAEFLAALSGPETARRARSSATWPLLVREASRLLHEEYAGDYPSERLQGLSLPVPVRVYTGGRSHPALNKVARKVSERIGGSRLVKVADAGHAVQTQEKRFDAELLAVTMDTTAHALPPEWERCQG